MVLLLAVHLQVQCSLKYRTNKTILPGDRAILTATVAHVITPLEEHMDKNNR